MLGLIEHRGPDAFGVYLDHQAGLGSARLSIIDLDGGNQPIHNEDESIWIVFNGEIFNYVELRTQLMQRGHRFSTSSDTEVLIHLYEEAGERCVESLNGQFAFAIWDSRSKELLLGRDRLGVRPLFYAVADGTLVFGSEIKAIFGDRRVSRELDLRALDQVFTCWAPLPGRTAFRAVSEVPPGHTLTVRHGTIRLREYWSLSFPPAEAIADRREEEYVEAFRALLEDATRLRLRADVPVGAYLSGGIDSSAVAAIVRSFDLSRLHAFSITFEDTAFDESPYQRRMARHLGVEHHTVHCRNADLAAALPDVIWHCEVPLLRSAPVPLFLLSDVVRQHGFKVVLTGEGADEFLAGYDIFKEDQIRRFWARDPSSRLRPLLLRRLYPDVKGLQRSEQAYLEAFFANGLSETHRKGYSHLIRWRNTARLKRLFSPGVRQVLAGHDAESELESALDDRLLEWPALSRAQYVEVKTFLSQYLLSAQGDRMAMAHSVETRFPFLDHRLVEFCAQVPPSLKLRRLEEKHLLKRAVADLVPEEILRRHKQPYRAPIRPAFFGEDAPEYVPEILSPAAVRRAGYFAPDAVSRLVQKASRAHELGETDSMAIMGVLSTQLLHLQYVAGAALRANLSLPELAVVADRAHACVEGQGQS
jgi:asparagine synthase (glutamine-hydrolysing)